VAGEVLLELLDGPIEHGVALLGHAVPGESAVAFDGERDDGLAVADHLDAPDRALESAQVRRGVEAVL